MPKIRDRVAKELKLRVDRGDFDWRETKNKPKRHNLRLVGAAIADQLGYSKSTSFHLIRDILLEDFNFITGLDGNGPTKALVFDPASMTQERLSELLPACGIHLKEKQIIGLQKKNKSVKRIVAEQLRKNNGLSKAEAISAIQEGLELLSDGKESKPKQLSFLKD